MRTIEANEASEDMRRILADTIAELGRVKAQNAVDLAKLAEAISLGNAQAAQFDAALARVTAERDELASALRIADDVTSALFDDVHKGMTTLTSNERLLGLRIARDSARAALERLKKEGK